MPSPEERQAAALEELTRTMKSFVRIHTVLNDNIVHLERFLEKRQEEIDTPATSTTRIPVLRMPIGVDDPPIGWAEIDANHLITIKIPGASLVDDIEYLRELGYLKALYLATAFESGPSRVTANDVDGPINEGGDTNAAG